jgi:hypothetical protein
MNEASFREASPNPNPNPNPPKPPHAALTLP